MHFLALFHTARTLFGSLRSPPSPRGEGFIRRYSFSTYACIPLTLWGKRYSRIAAFPIGEGGPRQAVDRGLSLIVDLRCISSLFFIPLELYPARYARHLPHAGKALSVVILFPHMRVFAMTLWGKRYSRIAAFPIGEGGPRQRWIGDSR